MTSTRCSSATTGLIPLPISATRCVGGLFWRLWSLFEINANEKNCKQSWQNDVYKYLFGRTVDDNAAVAGVVGEFEFAAPEPVLDPRFPWLPVRDELSDERLE